MKPSTFCELAGFVCLTIAAWWLIPIAGMAVAGASCLLVGYAIEDDKALMAFKRGGAQLTARRARRKARRADRKKK